MNSFQICTKAVQSIVSVLIQPWLFICGLTNDVTTAAVQVWPDPLSSQDLHFLPKMWRYHQKYTFCHCPVIQSQPAEWYGRAVSPGVASKQWTNQMWVATASMLRNNTLWHIIRAKYETTLNFIVVCPDFKELWDSKSHSTCARVDSLTLISLLSIPGYSSLLQVFMNFCSLTGNWMNKSSVHTGVCFPLVGYTVSPELISCNLLNNLSPLFRRHCHHLCVLWWPCGSVKGRQESVMPGRKIPYNSFSHFWPNAVSIIRGHQ